MRAAAALLALLIAIGGAGVVFLTGLHIPLLNQQIPPVSAAIKLGLDIKGGARLVFEGVDTPDAKATPDTVRQAMKVINYRVDKLGVSEPLVQMEGDNRIIVELAGVQDVDEAVRLVGSTAFLQFIGPDAQVIVSGRQLQSAQLYNPLPGEYGVSLQFKPDGAQAFAAATEKFLNQPIAIVLDNIVISAPTVTAVIPSGEAQITGNFSLEEAQQLVDLLNGGALPITLDLIERRQVSATLGTDSLAKSMKAGLIGLILVAAFMILYYRVPGLLAVAALATYLMLTVGALAGLGAVLTLPGIAGIILSLGMAVDANVIIFERIREELRAGKGLRGGIDAGFSRAYTAVLDANVTTILAAAVLYWLGTGPIKGFGLTLGLGVLISMFTAITFSRWLVRLTAATRWFGKPLFGVAEEVRA